MSLAWTYPVQPVRRPVQASDTGELAAFNPVSVGVEVGAFFGAHRRVLCSVEREVGEGKGWWYGGRRVGGCEDMLQ